MKLIKNILITFGLLFFPFIASAQSLLYTSQEIDLATILNVGVIYEGILGQDTLITDIFVVVTDTNVTDTLIGYFAVNADDHNYANLNPWTWAYQLTGMKKVGDYMRLDPAGVHSLIKGDERLWLNSVAVPYILGAPNPTFKVKAYVFGYLI